MEHLAIYSPLNLQDFCKRLETLLDISEFKFDSENDTEWGESRKNNLTINVSRPFEIGTLQEWDNTVPADCNFGITISKEKIDLNQVQKIGQLIANEFKSTLHYHRTWLEPGKNIERDIKIKANHNNMYKT